MSARVAACAFEPAVKRRGYPVGTATSRRSVVLAMVICTAFLGLAIAPRSLMPHDDHPGNAMTVRKIRAYVDDGYAMWHRATDSACPAQLLDLRPFIGETNDLDAWGTGFSMTCADTASGHTIIVRSAGEDHRFGTADDLWSDR